MRRFILALSLVLASCGGGGSEPATNPDLVTIRVNNNTGYLTITALDLWYSDNGAYWGRAFPPFDIPNGSFLQWDATMVGPDADFDIQAIGFDNVTGDPDVAETLLDVPIARGGYVEVTFNGLP